MIVHLHRLESNCCCGPDGIVTTGESVIFSFSRIEIRHSAVDLCTLYLSFPFNYSFLGPNIIDVLTDRFYKCRRIPDWATWKIFKTNFGLLLVTDRANMQAKYIFGLLALIALASAAYSDEQINLRPIIGILTQPYQRDDSPLSYIAASYVKVRKTLHILCTIEKMAICIE